MAGSTDAIVNKHLTKFAVANRFQSATGFYLFPVMMENLVKGSIPKSGDDAPDLIDTRKAPNANTKFVDDNIEYVDFETQDHTIAGIIPKKVYERMEKLAQLGRKSAKVKFLQNIQQIDVDRKIRDIVENTASYAAANTVTLAGNDQWTDTANSDPIGDIETAKEAVANAIGVEPEELIMHLGPAAWLALKAHPDILDLLRPTTAPAQPVIPTKESVAKALGIRMIVVGRARYKSGATTSALWGANAILAYNPTLSMPAEYSEGQPFFGATVRLEGNPYVDEWYDQDRKGYVVRANDELVPKLLNNQAAYLIKAVA